MRLVNLPTCAGRSRAVERMTAIHEKVRFVRRKQHTLAELCARQAQTQGTTLFSQLSRLRKHGCMILSVA
jgi:hypothetical protein